MSLSREENEIRHGKLLLQSGAEEIWGHVGPAGQKRVERRMGEFIRLGKIGAGKKILELGCGTGVFTAELAKSGAEITALDISPDLLAKAKEKVVSGNVIFFLGSAEKLEEYFSPDAFDAVVGNSILHHLDHEAALRAAFAVLKPGGKLVFSEPNMMNPQIFLERNVKWFKKMMHNSPDETAFFRWRLKRFLKSEGYKNINVVPFDFLHPAAPKILVSVMQRAGLVLEKLPLIKEFSGSLLIYAEKH